jgi:hypothetical protein
MGFEKLEKIGFLDICYRKTGKPRKFQFYWIILMAFSA